MNVKITNFIHQINTDSISASRKSRLNELSINIANQQEKKQPILINFICTHNSRRSHLGQIWMQTLANYFNLNISCFSGGTESTAIAKQVIKTIQNQGFEVDKLSNNNNPVYAIKYGKNVNPIICFSKKYDNKFNPASDFLAVMTCSEADEGCPIVIGSKNRIPITYEDPKKFDNTEKEAEKYLERSIQIATEMYYVLSQIKK